MLVAWGIAGIFFFPIIYYLLKINRTEKLRLLNFWGFYFFVLLFLLEPVPDQLNFGNVLFVAFLMIIVLYFILANKGLFNASSRDSVIKVVFVIGLFLIWSLVSTTIAIVFKDLLISDAFRAFIPFLFLIMAIPFSMYLKNEADFLKFTLGLCFLGSLYSLKFLYHFLRSGLDSQFTDVLYKRITLIDPSTTLPFTLFISILCFFMSIYRFRESTYFRFYAYCSVFNFVGAAVTLTRSMILAIICTIFVFLVILFVRRNTRQYLKKLKKIGMFLSVGMILVLVIPSPVQALIGAFVSRFKKILSGDDNVSVRVNEYLDAWNVFAANPVFGGGIGVKFSLHGTSFTNYIHNVSFYMLANVGLIGLLLYLLQFYVILKGIKGRNMYAFSYSAGLFGVLLYSQFFASFKLIHNNILIAACLVIIAVANSTRDNPVVISNV